MSLSRLPVDSVDELTCSKRWPPVTLSGLIDMRILAVGDRQGPVLILA